MVGKDGVGDYTRRLVAELAPYGVTASIVACFDKEVGTPTRESQSEQGVEVPVLRIPYGSDAEAREALLQETINSFAPDVVSLQYVPYSFSPVGIPYRFARQLGGLRFPGRWHIMFHELWIAHRGWRQPKQWAVASLQALTVGLLARQLQPAIVHTHVPLYRQRLSRLSVSARPLPLFANIASVKGAVREPAPPRGPFVLGYFSQLKVERTLHFINDLTGWLRADGGRELEIHLLGGGATRIAEARAILKSSFPEVAVTAPGFLPAGELSLALAGLDLGITPVDYHLLGKSGTVAAFLCHGVPVAAPYVTEPGEGFFVPKLSRATFSSFTPHALAAAQQAVTDLDTTVISAAGVARTFMADLGIRAGVSAPATHRSSGGLSS